MVTGYRLRVTGVTGYRLRVTGYGLMVTGYRGYGLQVTGYGGRIGTYFLNLITSLRHPQIVGVAHQTAAQ